MGIYAFDGTNQDDTDTGAAWEAVAHDTNIFRFFSAYEGTAWRNEVTLRSLELFQGYEPGEYLKRIAPTPLLMVVAPNDRLTPGEWACEAFETAAQPKRLVLLPGGHFDAYTGPGFEISSGAARDWFVEHLLQRTPALA